jgi:hypothetical protein
MNNVFIGLRSPFLLSTVLRRRDAAETFGLVKPHTTPRKHPATIKHMAVAMGIPVSQFRAIGDRFL